MRIAYLSVPAFLDCDVPLVSAMQKEADITYILNVNPANANQSMLRVGTYNQYSGVYTIADIKGFETVVKYIDKRKVYMFWQPSYNRLSLLWSVLKLLFFLIKGKFDIIHITWPLNYFSFPLYLLRKKMVLTVHDPLPHSSNISTNSQFYRKLAFRLINNFIILNNSQKNEFVSTYNLYNKNIFESRLGVYYHLSDVNIKEPLRKNYVLFFGNISSYKGLDLLCKAMRNVKTKLNFAHLIVAGRGNIYFDIEQYISDGTIEFRNYYISDEELAGLIKNAAFVVCPYTDATQSGVVMSSFSQCTPVVVTNVGGLPEMIGDGKYGAIIPAKSLIELENIIEELLTHPEKLNIYKSNIANDYYMGEYSWTKIGHDMVSYYKTIKSL